jgi:hypothetical protein
VDNGVYNKFVNSPGGVEYDDKKGATDKDQKKDESDNQNVD